MGLITNILFGGKEKRFQFLSLSDLDNMIKYGILGGTPTKSGTPVNEFSALKYSGVWAATRILSETLASLPLFLLLGKKENSRSKAYDHPLFDILHDRANDEMTSFVWRETMQAHLVTWGNCYSEIERGNDGWIKGLWPLRPDRVAPFRAENGSIKYKIYLPNKEEVILPAYNILHIPGLGFDGLVGYSPISMAREAIGLGLSSEEFGANFFSQGTHMGGIVTSPLGVRKDRVESFKKDMKEQFEGLGKSHRLAVLEEGMEYHNIGIPPNDAQFLETRKFQINEIARIFRIPPHLLADLEHATFSNIEEQSLEFVQYTMMPWLTRWEQAINNKLLIKSERQVYFAKFSVDGLLRADSKSRSDYYNKMFNIGAFSVNKILEFEDINPIGEDGDIHFVPLNMVPIEYAAKPPEEKQPSFNKPDDQKNSAELFVDKRTEKIVESRKILANAYKGMFKDAISRIVNREINDIKRATKKTDFNDWLKSYYEEFKSFISKQITPVIESYVEMLRTEVVRETGIDVRMNINIDDYVSVFNIFYAKEARDYILQLVNDGVTNWEEQYACRVDEVAEHELKFIDNQVSVVLYQEAGMLRKKWVSSEESCALCKSLNGKVVGIKEGFLEVDDRIHGDEKKSLLKINPAHPKCNCYIIAD